MNCYQTTNALITKISLLPIIWLYYSSAKQHVTRDSNSMKTSEHVQLVVPLHQNAPLAAFYCQLSKSGDSYRNTAMLSWADVQYVIYLISLPISGNFN